MESQIAGLDDLHAYLKHGNNVAQFNFNYISLPKVSPGFVSRTGAEGELSFDPRHAETAPSKARSRLQTSMCGGGTSNPDCWL